MLAPKKQLTSVIPFLNKKSLQLRSLLVNSVNKTTFLQLKAVFQSQHNLNTLFWFKDILNKRSSPFLFIDTRAVTATLLITVKLTVIFSLEL